MNRYSLLLLTIAIILAFLAFRKYFTDDKGIGDSVHSVTSWLGIKQWENCGCKVRQEKWNVAIPY